MCVGPNYCSHIGIMHGGAISLIFDLCTTMCAAPSDFRAFGGVSRTLNVTFLRHVRQGSWVRIYCVLLHIGFWL
ncbi:HotDog domain-containing protein [Aspergillus taichungensis]|uniref:HotDog domain-containing protein n=1 Tax=Aspergillus taichungensis TaxID=482145 RepID=A0A2J5HTN3_9EURO|nr:HotDog domain-containing protein [Aspergillus taichungensis]